MTPLSGQHYLKPKEPMQVTPVSTATYLVSRLNALIGGSKAAANQDSNQPSEKLTALLSECGGPEAKESVVKRIEDLGQTFIQNYVQVWFTLLRNKGILLQFFALNSRYMLLSRLFGNILQ